MLWRLVAERACHLGGGDRGAGGACAQAGGLSPCLRSRHGYCSTRGLRSGGRNDRRPPSSGECGLAADRPANPSRTTRRGSRPKQSHAIRSAPRLHSA
jgi:hypothetical protein